MKIAFTFRNFESSDSLKGYATDKVAKLQKYLHAPLSATLTFSVERHLHCVDLLLHAGGETYLAREENEDMYASIDLVIDKIRRQFGRVKGAHEQSRRVLQSA
ncbi:MAG TPA: ribosome-associated translation inhibitor RaiA [Polyangiales bacterium]|nr:ribosome-associated translation inhibitor RaiA [Polyangiales bacterium]